jgi:hypothetical protein
MSSVCNSALQKRNTVNSTPGKGIGKTTMSILRESLRLFFCCLAVEPATTSEAGSLPAPVLLLFSCRTGTEIRKLIATIRVRKEAEAQILVAAENHQS